jgi:prevent-host-death family protein
MPHLPASKARQGFADTINRAAYGKERVVVRRRGKDIAAVVPIDDLRLLEELEDWIDLVDARAALAETKKKGETARRNSEGSWPLVHDGLLDPRSAC